MGAILQRLKPLPNPNKRYTAKDYRALPEGPPYYQLIDGHLLCEPSPTTCHQSIAGELHLILGAWTKKKGAGKCFFAPVDVWLSRNDVVEPDLFFISNAKTNLLRKDGFHGGPDLVVEILSPSTARLDRTVKRTLYAKAGVRELWLIDPQLRQVAVHDLGSRRDDAAKILSEGDRIRSPILPGLEIDVAAIFLG
jgi:Uma2 family endonuclease